MRSVMGIWEIETKDSRLYIGTFILHNPPGSCAGIIGTSNGVDGLVVVLATGELGGFQDGFNAMPCRVALQGRTHPTFSVSDTTRRIKLLSFFFIPLFFPFPSMARVSIDWPCQACRGNSVEVDATSESRQGSGPNCPIIPQP